MCEFMAEPKQTNIETEGDFMALEKPSASNLGKLQTDSDSQMKVQFCESTDIELEWQWVIDQQQKDSKCCLIPLAQSKDATVEISRDDAKEVVHDSVEDFTKYQQEIESSETIRGNAWCSIVDQVSQVDLNGKQSAFGALNSQRKSRNLDIHLHAYGLNGKQSSISSAVKTQEKSRDLSKELHASKLKYKNTGSWRTADRMELAALLFQTSLQSLENCDLPSSQSSFTFKEPLANCDLTPSKTCKSDCCRPINKGQAALAYVENIHPPLSAPVLGMSDPLPLQKHVLKTSQSPAIPALEGSIQTVNAQEDRYVSLDDKNMGWSGRGRNFSGGGNTLGEALCHSQTRAREAEKAAVQALEEKEQLIQFIFRESSLSLAYRQWVRLLEIENTWLKMHARYHPALWMEHAFLNPAVAFEQLSKNHWKQLVKKSNQQHV
eukprot:c23034_g1_i1 orf=396-1700(+)